VHKFGVCLKTLVICQQVRLVTKEDADAVLKASGVIPYSNSLTLCYDETGMPYRLPIAILSDPKSYMPEHEE
jgi:hypothetical protein